MKDVSNTAIAAIIAVGLAALVGILPVISFFQRWEDLTSDGMMSLSYDLHKKVSPLAIDPDLFVTAIDTQSIAPPEEGGLGRWPFPRSVHGQFLALLQPEQPKVVAWDIFFTETSLSPGTTAPAPQDTPASAPSDNSAAPAPGSSPAPGTANPSASAPPPVSQPAPAASGTSPASTPSAPSTNASSAVPPITMIGADPSSANMAPAANSSVQNVAPATTAPPADSLDEDDQALVQGVSLFPHLVTAAEVNDERPALKTEELLPTKPFKNVVGDTSHLFYAKSALVPFPELRKESYFGFANEEGGTGGVRRKMYLIVNVGGQIYPSFDFQTLMQFWGVDPDQVVINIGHEIVVTKPDGSQAHIPIDNQGNFTINYRGRLEDFAHAPYSFLGAALADKMNNKNSDALKKLPLLKDKLVVIGVTFNGTDAGVTPLDNNAPLVVTHLNTLNNILQHDFLRPVDPWIWMPVYAIILFIAGNLMLRVGIAPMIPIGLLAMLIVSLIGFAALWFGNWQVPVAGPEFGLLVMASVIPTKRFFGEEREKRIIKAAMSASLSEKVMKHMLAHPDNVKLGGVKRPITVMFCDIRGFTKYCDNRDSSEVMDVLNDYMEEMTAVVFKYDGTVDKYIGDCIMAFWNAPDDQPDHAQRAVCCAMEMRYALAAFKTKRAGLDIELFECGIGIHTGEALVGQMGSSLKRSYTAMGSTVNMGARLEALTKRLNERILISADVKAKLEGDFPLTDRGEATVPGFALPVHVFAVGADQDISSALKVGRTLATKQEYTAEEVTAPIWKPAPLPEDADPNP
ncbi:MAG: CHASE2 domain-containing protein [Methylacidiphilales bacterium]|nr:CHASE2 domain-containing protein [Candidatus Methylacidiphilales bacterium]